MLIAIALWIVANTN